MIENLPRLHHLSVTRQPGGAWEARVSHNSSGQGEVVASGKKSPEDALRAACALYREIELRRDGGAAEDRPAETPLAARRQRRGAAKIAEDPDILV